MTITLIQAIKAAVKLDNLEHSNKRFQKAIADIQNLIGQDDGGNASMYFDDNIVDNWKHLDSQQRFHILQGYVVSEMGVFESEFKD